MKGKSVQRIFIATICVAVLGGAWLALRIADEPIQPLPSDVVVDEAGQDVPQFRAQPEAPQPEALVDLHATRRDQAFIDEAFPLLSRGELEPLKSYLAPATLAANSEADLHAVLRTLGAHLGELDSYDPPEAVHLLRATDTQASIDNLRQYHFRATFQGGTASVELVLQDHPDGIGRSLHSFNIDIPRDPLARSLR